MMLRDDSEPIITNNSSYAFRFLQEHLLSYAIKISKQKHRNLTVTYIVEDRGTEKYM